MEKIKVGINGFGRIGMACLRAMWMNGGFEIVAINDLTATKTLAKLLKNDSVRNRFPAAIEFTEDTVIIGGIPIPVMREKDPANLNWGRFGNDVIVLECTGRFTTEEELSKHLTAGAARVLLSAPPKGPGIPTIVLGVNENEITPESLIISNASCTSNSIGAPLAVLDKEFGIHAGLMTTVHSATNDQRVVDAVHEDPRRARSVLGQLIPTKTGAAAALGEFFRPLKGKFNGGAIRTPTPDGSISVIHAVLKREVTVEEVNAALKLAADTTHWGIIDYSEEDLVLTDIVGNSASAVIDSLLTKAVTFNGMTIVEVNAWYDNEWGYSMRMLDLIRILASYLPKE
jgi:glyceraldehyde 3-phosphate dehydrogenase